MYNKERGARVGTKNVVNVNGSFHYSFNTTDDLNRDLSSERTMFLEKTSFLREKRKINQSLIIVYLFFLHIEWKIRGKSIIKKEKNEIKNHSKETIYNEILDVLFFFRFGCVFFLLWIKIQAGNSYR